MVDWKEKSVAIYYFADECKYIEAALRKVVTEENKDKLEISTFPDITISFEELFRNVL